MSKLKKSLPDKRNSLQKINTVWQPNPGSQELFLSCPYYEVLYDGTRGPGKTDGLLMDFAQHIGTGFGQHWRGILFREEYPQLEDVIAKSKRWFFQIFPGAKFNEGDYFWAFPKGERLYFRHMKRPDDYWKYHGHEYPWIGWEELTNWAMPGCYESMKACCRSSYPGMPRKIRSTANPYGKGHGWVKARFVDPAPPGVPITGEDGLKRVRIRGIYAENLHLLKADPDYIKRLNETTDLNKKKAWLFGSWDIVAGGALDDMWDPEVHPIAPFQIPKSWYIDRSFDWGSSKPFGVGWWAESDGTEATLADGSTRIFPRGTLFLISEFYGWNGNPNEGCKMLAVEVARKIMEAEKHFPFRVMAGPADSSIYQAENGVCIADDMLRVGVKWTAADKKPGSRATGLEALRKRLKASMERPMETPGLFIFDTCRHWIRTVPTLPRDPKKPDDVDSEADDHLYDLTRYRIMTPKLISTSQEFLI